MKLVWIFLLFSIPLFGQKPLIQQKNYNWNQQLSATISDRGGFVLTEGIPGLYVYNTATRESALYAEAFNGVVSSDERLIIFQKPQDTLGVLNNRDHRMVYVDSVAGYQLINASVLVQKVNGALYCYQDTDQGFVGRPIALAGVKKYVENKAVYYSTRDGILIRYNLGSKRADTIFQGGKIKDFVVNKSVFVRVGKDIIVIKGDKSRVNMSQLLDERFEISDQGFQVEAPTGRVYFKTVRKKVISRVASNEPYSDMQVWNAQDPYLYPMLLQEQVDSSHNCMYDPERNKVIDFGGGLNLSVKTDVANEYIIGLTPMNVFERYWQRGGRASCYLINTGTGVSKEIYHEMDGYLSMPFQLQMDPKQRYLLYYDLVGRKYRVYNIALGTETVLGKDPKLVFDDIDEDPSSSPAPYGIAGWSEDGRFAYVYDKYDIWKMDLEGRNLPLCVTQGIGVKMNRRFRLVDGSIKENDDLLMTCFDFESRDNGFYFLNIKRGRVRELVMDAHLYFNPGGSILGEQPIRSRDKKYWLFSRMSAGEFPNYFITKKFDKITPVTSFSPQMSYNWMRSKLMKMGDVEGILYVPENFDEHKKYPIIFYLYEKFTDGINRFIYPQLSDGTLNIPWYVSNGYLVFSPDVNYRTNEPGESVLRTVKTARDYFARQVYVDSSAIGVQGHSFGGYEVNYIVTHYNGFAAACAVSGASNLFTSYGNLRFGGMPGQIDFERGQFRMRRPVWEMPEVFLKNSPISSTGGVTTPLLLVSNKRDSTVLWSHAVEMFTAMRRQGKQCWLLQYDHSHHVISMEDGLDFSLRMQGYFDYYLRHKREPEWMKEETGVRERSRLPVGN